MFGRLSSYTCFLICSIFRKSRLVWYQVMTALEDESTQKGGIVCIYDFVDFNPRNMFGGDRFSKVAEFITKGMQHLILGAIPIQNSGYADLRAYCSQLCAAVSNVVNPVRTCLRIIPSHRRFCFEPIGVELNGLSVEAIGVTTALLCGR